MNPPLRYTSEKKSRKTKKTTDDTWTTQHYYEPTLFFPLRRRTTRRVQMMIIATVEACSKTPKKLLRTDDIHRDSYSRHTYVCEQAELPPRQCV